MHLNSRQPIRTIGTPDSLRNFDKLSIPAARLGAHRWTQSAVHGIVAARKVSLHRSLIDLSPASGAPSHPSVAVKRTDSDTSIGSFSHHGKGWKLIVFWSAGSPSPQCGSSLPLHLLESPSGAPGARAHTPNSAARSSSAYRSLRRQPPCKMRRSRSLSTESASPSALPADRPFLRFPRVWSETIPPFAGITVLANRADTSPPSAGSC